MELKQYYSGPKTWALLPKDIKYPNRLIEFLKLKYETVILWYPHWAQPASRRRRHEIGVFCHVTFFMFWPNLPVNCVNANKIRTNYGLCLKFGMGKILGTRNSVVTSDFWNFEIPDPFGTLQVPQNWPKLPGVSKSRCGGLIWAIFLLSNQCSTTFLCWR